MKRALLVGVNKYLEPGNDLSGCVNDVTDVYELLTTKFGFEADNVRVLTDARATQANILVRLEWLVSSLEPGDVVLLLTDGLPEARSPEDSSFGIERAIDVIRNNRDRTAGEIVASVYRAWRRFSGREAPLDDITVVVCKVGPAPPGARVREESAR